MTFGFSGDVDWKWRPYPLITALNAEPFDFFIFLGDTIYETTNLAGTTSVEDLDGYREKYRENRQLPAVTVRQRQRSVARHVSALWTVRGRRQPRIRDVRGGCPSPRYTEGGAPARRANFAFVNQTPGFKGARAGFLGVPTAARPTVAGTVIHVMDGTRGFYFSQPWGTAARFIVADDRSYRDVRLPTPTIRGPMIPARTVLGGPQLAWLEHELSAAQTDGVTWKVVVISSPIQHIGRASEVGADLDGTKSWEGGYRVERDRLLEFIDDNGIDNVVFLTTDNHYTMVNNLRYRAGPGGPRRRRWCPRATPSRF